MEDFVQQSGRAGRDGEDAEAVAFVAPGDTAQQRHMALQGKEAKRRLEMCNEMSVFFSQGQCRRQLILRHFGEEIKEGPERRGECVRVEGRAICRWDGRLSTIRCVGRPRFDMVLYIFRYIHTYT